MSTPSTESSAALTGDHEVLHGAHDLGNLIVDGRTAIEDDVVVKAVELLDEHLVGIDAEHDRLEKRLRRGRVAVVVRDDVDILVLRGEHEVLERLRVVRQDVEHGHAQLDCAAVLLRMVAKALREVALRVRVDEQDLVVPAPQEVRKGRRRSRLADAAFV